MQTLPTLEGGRSTRTALGSALRPHLGRRDRLCIVLKADIRKRYAGELSVDQGAKETADFIVVRWFRRFPRAGELPGGVGRMVGSFLLTVCQPVL